MAAAQIALNVVGTTISLALTRGATSSALQAARAAMLVVTAATALALWLAPRRWTPRVGALAFLVNLLPVGALLWTINVVDQSSGVIWEPFRTYELSTITVALLAPHELWAGLVGEAMLVSLALVQNATFPAAARRFIPFNAVWAVVAFGAFSVVLLLFRHHQRRVELEKSRMAEEAHALRRVNEILVAVRDLTNTPLQALAVDCELLLRQPAQHARIVERVERSVRKLRALDAMLQEFVREAPAETPRDSFDAASVLQEWLKRRG
jgi:hypothetical protein